MVLLGSFIDVFLVNSVSMWICLQEDVEKTETETGLGGTGKEGIEEEEERLKEEEVQFLQISVQFPGVLESTHWRG